jgi:hypothetical protein
MFVIGAMPSSGVIWFALSRAAKPLAGPPETPPA